jgi:hypothetical protein
MQRALHYLLLRKYMLRHNKAELLERLLVVPPHTSPAFVYSHGPDKFWLLPKRLQSTSTHGVWVSPLAKGHIARS